MIKSNGHIVANHSFNHVKFSKLSLTEQIKEIDKTNKILTLTKCKDENIKCFFRPPGGIWSIKLLFKLYLRDIVLVNWSRDSLDCYDKTSNQIISMFKSEPVKNGDIILFHDDDEKSIDILTALIPLWLEQKYSCELISY